MGSSVEHGRARRAVVLGGLALVLVLSLLVSVHPWYDPTNDGSMYISTARSIAAGEGYRYLGLPFLIRPPGFSVFLAPLLALFGTRFYALNLAVSLCGALGVLAFHLHLRERLGLVLATLVPLLVWFNPGYQRLSNQVMSDVPGWALFVGCLALAARARARATRRWAFLLGVATGLASFMRAGNLLLLPAWIAAELLRAQKTGWRDFGLRSAALVLGALLVLAPWAARNRAVAPPPPADQTLLYSYSSGMWNVDMGDPRSPRLPWSAVLARFPEQAGKSLRTLGTRLQEEGTGPGIPLFGALLVLALGVAAVRRRAPEELFALGTLLVVSLYFGYAGRLLLPVYALAAVALLELVRDGLARLAGARAGLAASTLACLAWMAFDWDPRAHWPEIEALHKDYVESARQIQAQLAPGARLGAWRGWHHAVYLERPVYSFEQACERAGRPEACEEIIDKYSLDTALLTPLGLPASVVPAERQLAAYLARRYGGRALGLVRVR